MKYGIQITTTKDGSWSVSQLSQKQPNGEYTRVQTKVIFIDHSDPNAAAKLLDTISKGLKGKIAVTRGI